MKVISGITMLASGLALSATCLAVFTSGCAIELGQPITFGLPAVSVSADIPVVVEEGAVYNGAVVVAPVDIAACEWVLVGDSWNYWNPGCGAWVHADRAYGWHPDHYRRLNSWAERSREHRGADGRMVRERSAGQSRDRSTARSDGRSNGRSDGRMDATQQSKSSVKQPAKQPAKKQPAKQPSKSDKDKKN